VSAASKYVSVESIDHVCTAGGAMVQYISGKEMPLIEAMKKAYDKFN
jgi:phosphoglycerate kinase